MLVRATIERIASQSLTWWAILEVGLKYSAITKAMFSSELIKSTRIPNETSFWLRKCLIDLVAVGSGQSILSVKVTRSSWSRTY